MDTVPTDEILHQLKRRCSILSGKPKRILLFGAPGCGKGTQSEWLNSELGLVHLSTGDILRSAIAQGSPVGVAAEKAIAEGKLIPDEVILTLVRKKFEEIGDAGFVLDGFPRTLNQAKGLDVILKDMRSEISCVLHLRVDDDTLIKRICGRRIHVPSGRAYHVDFKPPKVPDIDDITGERLVHRPDDNEESFVTRLNNYKKITQPVIDHYLSTGLLFQIDGSQSPDQVRKDIELLFQLGNVPEKGRSSV